jgi:dienelactone hydrolase
MRRPTRPILIAAMAGLVLLAACLPPTPRIVTNVNTLRQSAGLPALVAAATLNQAAIGKASEMCTSGVVPTPAPADRYDAETWAAVREFVGSAPLDPAITDPTARTNAAVDAVWAEWQTDPAFVDPRWDTMGNGQVSCANGVLTMATVLADTPTIPATGRFVSPQVPATDVTVVADQVYGTAPDHLGRTVSLALDLYLPPPGGPALRPTVVLVHGGGFKSGSRANLATVATEYARRGYVAASISYRLRPNSTPEETLAAATDAVDDGMEAVRWLKANAATYGIDTTRIGMLGTSAGGAIALGVALASDPTPGGPLGAISPSVAGSVSTGASLTAGLGSVGFEASDAPVLMHHYETDTATGDTSAYAFQTCSAVRASGNTCDFVTDAGAGHTTNIGPSGVWWTPEFGPFLWHHLRLATV